MTGRNRGRHRPAHALPTAKGATLRALRRRRAARRRAADDGRASALRRARDAVVATRGGLTRGWDNPPIAEVGADMLMICESRWKWAVRAVRSPAFAIVAMSYVVGAWIVVGAPTPRPTASSTNAANVSVTAPTALSTVPDHAAHSQVVAVPESVTPAANIDPQFFDGLQKVLRGLDSPAERAPTRNRPELDDSSAGTPALGNPPALDAAATGATSEPPTLAPPNDQGTDAASSDVPVPVITPSVQPTTPSSVPVNDQPLPSPASSAPAVDQSAGAPAADVAVPVAAPNPQPSSPPAATPADGQSPAN